MIQERGKNYNYQNYQKKEAPVNVDNKYIIALWNSGYEEYIPLLDSATEAAFFQDTRSRFRDILRTPPEKYVDQMANPAQRKAVASYMKRGYDLITRVFPKLSEDQLGVLGGYDKEILKLMREKTLEPRLKRWSFANRIGYWIIPPEELFYLCGLNPITRSAELTDFGRIVAKLYKDFPNISLFLLPGASLETLQYKPEGKRWPVEEPEKLSARLMQETRIEEALAQIKGLMLGSETPRPDADILVCWGNRAPDNNPSNKPLDSTVDLLWEMALSSQEALPGLDVEVKQSKRRSVFSRTDIGLPPTRITTDDGHEILIPRSSIGHLFFSAGCDKSGKYGYDPKNAIIKHMLTQSNSEMPILLIPDTHDRKTLLWGVGLDFFGARDRLKLRLKFSNRTFHPAFYPSNEILFPDSDHAQTLFIWGRMTRNTWSWCGELPVFTRFGHWSTTEDFQQAVVDFQYFAQQTLVPRIRNAEHCELGTTNQRIELARSLIMEDLKGAFTGDPLISLLMLGNKGETYSTDIPGIDIPDWIIGWGVFGKEGIFPALGEFLATEISPGIKRGDMLVHEMARLPQGNTLNAKHRIGWEGFLNSINKLSSRQPEENVDLFKPCWL